MIMGLVLMTSLSWRKLGRVRRWCIVLSGMGLSFLGKSVFHASFEGSLLSVVRALILHKNKTESASASDSELQTLLHLRFRGKIAATGFKRTALVWGGGILDQVTTAPMLAGLAERAEKSWADRGSTKD